VAIVAVYVGLTTALDKLDLWEGSGEELHCGRSVQLHRHLRYAHVSLKVSSRSVLGYSIHTERSFCTVERLILLWTRTET